MSLLAFHDIHKSYGDTVALRGVSLEVSAGEVFGLLGPNGAGKTTLIRILLDIIRADQGRIECFGQPHHRGLLDRISFLPEERGLYSRLKVLEVMSYLGRLKGLGAERSMQLSEQWLERLGLAETGKWKIERLSKGMTQKVQIAVALMTEPELCVLDEPFSGLDPVNVRLVRELILERRDQGLTTVLSTHQMNEVETLCDRVAMINRGQRVLYGSVNSVRETHSVPEVYVEIDGEPPVLDIIAEAQPKNSGWRLLLREGTQGSELLSVLVNQGIRVHHFQRTLTPIEEIFVKVVSTEEVRRD